jgi:hypothetical protein
MMRRKEKRMTAKRKARANLGAMSSPKNHYLAIAVKTKGAVAVFLATHPKIDDPLVGEAEGQ